MPVWRRTAALTCVPHVVDRSTTCMRTHVCVQCVRIECAMPSITSANDACMFARTSSHQCVCMRMCHRMRIAGRRIASIGIGRPYTCTPFKLLLFLGSHRIDRNWPAVHMHAVHAFTIFRYPAPPPPARRPAMCHYCHSCM